MSRQPLLPKGNDPQSASKYRNDLHEFLLPQNTPWTPAKGGITASSVDASYSRMGRIWCVGLSMESVTATPGAYIDLPFTVLQYSVFNVAVNGDCLAAVVDKGGSRLYIPAFGPVGRVVISGVAVG